MKRCKVFLALAVVLMFAGLAGAQGNSQHDKQQQQQKQRQQHSRGRSQQMQQRRVYQQQNHQTGQMRANQVRNQNQMYRAQQQQMQQRRQAQRNQFVQQRQQMQQRRNQFAQLQNRRQQQANMMRSRQNMQQQRMAKTRARQQQLAQQRNRQNRMRVAQNRSHANVQQRVVTRPSVNTRAQPFYHRVATALPNRGRRPTLRPVMPMNRPHFVAAKRFVRPAAAISTRNYPRPNYGTTYVTNNITVISRNYNYDRVRYTPHVRNFYGRQTSYWGNRWRYGCNVNPTIYTSDTVNFNYPYYVYTPYYTDCVASPFYYDTYVPAYLPADRVAVWPSYNYDWSDGDTYNYIAGSPYGSYGDPMLNLAIQSLIGAYRHRDFNSIDSLLGTSDVAVFANNRYEYSLDANDFRDMFVDDCRDSRTTGFDVLSVRRHGDYGTIRCRHRFETPDGRSHNATVLYNLRRVGDRYAIADYMTSY